MTWRYREAGWGVGDLASPYAMRAEFDTIAAELNGGIDRDNLGEQVIGASKISLGCFNVLDQASSSLKTSVTLYPGSGWIQVTSTELVRTTGDSVVWLHGSCFIRPDSVDVYSASTYIDPVLAIRVDGEIVAVADSFTGASGSTGPSQLRTKNASAVVALPAGVHTFDLAIRAPTTVILPGQDAMAVEFEARRLILREMVR